MTLNLKYPEILQNFGAHLIGGRLESRAFLGWFLENYFRLDEQSAQDAICDGPNDKGIDGIYIDDNLERIEVFQTKLYQSERKKLGDSPLRDFLGALSQLETAEKVSALAEATGNTELRGLLLSNSVGSLIDDGYEVRGTFITNISADANAKSFLENQNQISLVDAPYLDANWVPSDGNHPIQDRINFSLDGLGHIRYQTPEAEVVVASLKASQLVEMAGIESQELFEWNVRQALGRTKVNKAISESVNTASEHKNFLFYHNGLTILAEDVILGEDDDLAVDRYTVVNGCQSLSTLYQNRSEITDELRVLARIIKLPPEAELSAKITRHSNNQNSISARDMQSNSGIQRRLQAEFERDFSHSIGYEIKRGEEINADRVISNQKAAQLLLATDLEQPWSCHQSYRLFDNLHNLIFARPEVTAKRIVVLLNMDDAVQEALAELDDELFAYYNLSRFFLLYLLRRAIGTDDAGRRFLQDPSEVVSRVGFDGIKEISSSIVSDLVIDLNAELSDRSDEGEPFDYKRELKSSRAVRAVATGVLTSYEKSIRRKRATSFSSEIERLAERG